MSDVSALLALGQKAMLILVLLSAGPLLVSLLVGVAIGVLQAATSIQEATLSFLPKLLAVLALLALMGPTMLRFLGAFTISVFGAIPGVVR